MIDVGGFLRKTLNLHTMDAKLDLILSRQGATMAAIDDLNKAQAAEKADLAVLTGLVTQLLTAFANGAMTPAQAQALLTEMNAEDASIKSNIGSIQSALGITPAPATTPTPTPVP